MRKLFFTLITALVTAGGYAQNIQAHYDMGKDRGYLTTTVEMFRVDKMGSTFFFVDMDYGSNDVEGISLAYWEIARSFKVSESAFEPRIEYNGGFTRISNDLTVAINNAYMAGMQYTWSNPEFTRVFSLQANYKYIQDKNNASFQITGVWGIYLFDRKVSMNGFADFWREDNVMSNGKETNYVFLSEPQFWYNMNKHFALGTEIELSSNFGANDKFKVCPTLALRWYP
jgi:hypothetical protein